jgi:hypothetical protein
LSPILSLMILTTDDYVVFSCCIYTYLFLLEHSNLKKYNDKCFERLNALRIIDDHFNLFDFATLSLTIFMKRVFLKVKKMKLKIN